MMQHADSVVQSATSLRYTVMLWLLVLASAVAVIYMTHVSRAAFIETQVLHAQAQAFDVEWGRLLIEKSNSSSIARLESIASNQLNMQVPDADHVVVLEESK
jgi:cell division protein FtsL